LNPGKPSSDYHDYVFKDGRLVGDFDGMYRHSADVPWHQDVNSFDLISDIDIAILKRGRFASICDIGCGLGYFTERMRTELLSPAGGPPQVLGVDVSPTAVEAAAREFPRCRFVVGDMLADSWPPVDDTFDLIVMRGVIWYVVHELDRALDRFAKLAAKGGKILVTLSFPPSDTWVGQDIIGSAGDLKDQLSSVMDIEYWCEERDRKHGNVPLCHAFGTVREADSS